MKHIFIPISLLFKIKYFFYWNAQILNVAVYFLASLVCDSDAMATLGITAVIICIKCI